MTDQFSTLSKEELLAKFPHLRKHDKAQTGQGSLSWRIKRLGKVTGSKAKALGTTTNKPSGNTKKADLVFWIEQQQDSAMHIQAAYALYEAKKGKPAQSLSDLTKPELMSIVDACKGKVELTRGAETLLYELLSECLIDRALLEVEETPEWLQGASSVATRWGNEYEKEAIKAYENNTGIEVQTETFTQWSEDILVGISPDGLVNQGSGAVEVKCPYNSTNHIRVMLSNGYDEKYIAQLIHTFVVCNVDFVDFVSYDPRMIGTKKLHIHRLNREDFAEQIAQHEFDLRFFLQQYRAVMKEHSVELA